MSRYFVGFLIFCLFVQVTVSCKGMQIFHTNVRNCMKNPVLEYVNTTVQLSQKCEVIIDGCSKVHQFSKASYNAKAFRDSMTVFEKSSELCGAQSEMARMGLAFVGITDGCTQATNMTKCFKNQKVFTLSKSLIRLMPSFMLGKSFYSVRVEMTHDTGKSCFEGDFIVKKSK